MRRLEQKEREAVLRLMADADDGTLGLIEEALEEYDFDPVSLLREAIRRADPSAAATLRQRLHSLTGPVAERNLRRIISTPRFDLERAAFAVAELEYPDMNRDEYVRYLGELADRLRARGAGPRDAGYAIASMNRLFFAEEGYAGEETGYDDPDCNYVNRVIETRRGVPVMLCSLYLFVAQRIDLPLCSISLPSHFLLRFQGTGGELFIDVFRRGRLLTRRECAEMLAESGVAYSPTHLAPASPRAVFRRMVMNLYLLYRRADDETRLRRMERVLDMLRDTVIGETR